jgi:hypothetical protein
VIREIDDWVLDRVQIASDVVHRFTGFDSTDQGRGVAAVTAAGWFAYCADSQTWHSFDWMAGLNLVVMLQRAVWGNSNNYSTRSAEGVRNVRRISPLDQCTRLFSLLLVVAYIVVIQVTLVTGRFDVGPIKLQVIITGTWLWWVLDALDPQTPAKSLIRRWFDAFTPWRKEISSTA